MKYTDIYVPLYVVTRVMKENLWSKQFALRVLEEYKKFLYLATKTNVAPSFEVDQMWHAHMLFSRDYEYMQNELGVRIHHQPTPPEEIRTTGKDEYQETLNKYHVEFNQEPPKDIWTRWKNYHHVYIDLNSHWVTPAGDWKAILKILFKHLKYKINGLFI